MSTGATYSEVVGRTMRLEREIRGVSMRAMADHVGLTLSGWSRVETGDTTATVDHLRLVAEKLGTRPGDILDQAERSWAAVRA